MIVIRVSVACLMYWILHHFTVKEKIKSTRDYFYLALCAIFGIAINQLMFFKGLAISTPINASLIMTIIPIMVLISSFLIIKEKITWLNTTGIVLGLTGAALLVLSGKESSVGSGTYRGDIFLLINSTSYGFYLVIVKPLMKKYHPYTIIKWVFLFGMFYVIPVGFNDLTEVDWNSITTNIWIAIAFVVVMTTFFAYLLNMVALKTLKPSVVGIYIYLQPILATIIAISFGKDSVTWEKVLFSLLIFAGVYFVSRRSDKKLSEPKLSSAA